MATSHMSPTERRARTWRDGCASRGQFGHSLAGLIGVMMLGALLSRSLLAQDAPLPSDTPAESKVTVAAYSTQVDPDQAADRLRLQFGANPQVKIVVDPRTRRILTQAPAAIQTQVAAELQRMEQTNNPAPSTTLGEAAAPSGPVQQDSQVAWTPGPTTEAQGRLQNLTWPSLLESLQAMTPDRKPLAPARTADGWRAVLPSSKGPTTLMLNPRTGQFQLVGPSELTDAWGQAIRALDKQTTAPMTQLVPIGKASPASIERAMTILENARSQAKTLTQRWGADVVGIVPRGSRQSVEVAQAPQPPQPFDNQGGDQPNDQVEVQVPATPDPGGVGVDGSLIGPVQIEYVEGLDAIIIRGRKQDVDRVMGIIDEIEELSAFTEPKIELVPLKHVNSQAMSEMVTQLNAQSSNVRLGTVNITPLVKPNALILIGREEGVDATIDLIERLDQPVAPSTQFHIFRLKYLPATDAATTITSFFQDRGGLSPRIQVQADFRTNSLIIYASPRDLEEVQQLLTEIDVADNAAESEVRVFKLNNALAEELAPVLEATLRGEAAPTAGGQPGGGQGGAATGVSARSTTLTMTRIDTQGKQILKSGILTEVRVAADVRANSLVVTAPAESMELIAALVEQLDELPTSEAEIKVFTIVNGDAASLTDMLNELFGQTQQGNQAAQLFQSAIGAGESTLVPLRFSTDLRTNSIIATGSAADLRVVEAILLRLDESDVTLRKTRVYRLQNAPASEVSNAINQYLQTERQITLGLAPETLSPFEQIEREVVVVPELVSNSLIISATPRYFDEIAEIVKDLDSQPPMVLIQVLIAEVDLENNEEFGVELGIQDSLLFDRSVVGDLITPGYNFNNPTLPLGNSGSAASLATREYLGGQGISNFGVGRTNTQLGYGGLVLSASSESINILLRALQESRRLDILSRPQVMTLNNQPAFVLVGQRVPRITSVNQTQIGTTNNTVLEPVGLVLGVTPRISPDGLVVMEIDAEKSELGDVDDGIPISINENGDVIRSPIIETTVAQTTVSARSGQTVILGGLITKDHASISRRVPYLSDIPLLGHLFRFDAEADLRRELLIIMTPYIVRKAEDAEWLNQIEAQRMSWCLADVINVHGDVGMGITSPGPNRISPDMPEVIFPDETNSTEEMVVPGSDESYGPSFGEGALRTLPEKTNQREMPYEIRDARTSTTTQDRPEVRSGQAPLPQVMNVPGAFPPQEGDVQLPPATRETRVISPIQY